mmetsp:Transcript_35526/g.81367  ORF Transcript_35526/g.81367 Transcript_35526/m.81367 type:complete len:739 (+) Transcript_35526:62-2278(+)
MPPKAKAKVEPRPKAVPSSPSAASAGGTPRAKAKSGGGRTSLGRTPASPKASAERTSALRRPSENTPVAAGRRLSDSRRVSFAGEGEGGAASVLEQLGDAQAQATAAAAATAAATAPPNGDADRSRLGSFLSDSDSEVAAAGPVERRSSRSFFSDSDTEAASPPTPTAATLARGESQMTRLQSYFSDTESEAASPRASRTRLGGTAALLEAAVAAPAEPATPVEPSPSAVVEAPQAAPPLERTSSGADPAATAAAVAAVAAAAEPQQMEPQHQPQQQEQQPELTLSTAIPSRKDSGEEVERLTQSQQLQRLAPAPLDDAGALNMKVPEEGGIATDTSPFTPAWSDEHLLLDASLEILPMSPAPLPAQSPPAPQPAGPTAEDYQTMLLRKQLEELEAHQREIQKQLVQAFEWERQARDSELHRCEAVAEELSEALAKERQAHAEEHHKREQRFEAALNKHEQRWRHQVQTLQAELQELRMERSLAADRLESERASQYVLARIKRTSQEAELKAERIRRARGILQQALLDGSVKKLVDEFREQELLSRVQRREEEERRRKVDKSKQALLKGLASGEVASIIDAQDKDEEDAFRLERARRDAQAREAVEAMAKSTTPLRIPLLGSAQCKASQRQMLPSSAPGVVLPPPTRSPTFVLPPPTPSQARLSSGRGTTEEPRVAQLLMSPTLHDDDAAVSKQGTCIGELSNLHTFERLQGDPAQGVRLARRPMPLRPVLSVYQQSA